MTKFLTRDCACTVTTGTGQARPEKCELHGNRFWTEAQLRPPERKVAAKKKASPRKPMKRSQPDRDWADARAKVEEEGCCRICKCSEASDRPLEAAHVLGREHDEPKLGEDGWPLKERYVDPDRIFPACGPSPGGCHGEAERKEINVLSVLSLSEQVKAVEDAGGIEAARLRLEPVAHREEVEATALASPELEPPPNTEGLVAAPARSSE